MQPISIVGELLEGLMKLKFPPLYFFVGTVFYLLVLPRHSYCQASATNFDCFDSLLSKENCLSGPLIWKDSTSGNVFIVESDRRHVDAVDKSGKLLWSREPFRENKLPPRRVARPQIEYIGPVINTSGPSKGKEFTNELGERIVGIRYNSLQFGVLNMRNGNFTFWGQD